MLNWDPAMNHICSGIWSPTSASAQEDIWAWQILLALGHSDMEPRFWTAQSPEWGSSTHSIYSVVHQCPIVLPLSKWGYCSCTANGSSLAREIITAFPFAPKCYNSASHKRLVDLKVSSWNLQKIYGVLFPQKRIKMQVKWTTNGLYWREYKHSHQCCVPMRHIHTGQMMSLNYTGLVEGENLLCHLSPA